MMTLDEYQESAVRTAAIYGSQNVRLAVFALGLAGEAGEAADDIKKVIGHGHDLDVDRVTKELGDVLWYIATLSDAIGVTLEHVAEVNVAKLRERYPTGFSKERSINR